MRTTSPAVDERDAPGHHARIEVRTVHVHEHRLPSTLDWKTNLHEPLFQPKRQNTWVALGRIPEATGEEVPGTKDGPRFMGTDVVNERFFFVTTQAVSEAGDA